MALFQKLLIRQTQALVMTPQLMQAIKLLQLSHLDLASYVDGEMERNPLLERPAEDEPARPDGEQGETSAAADDTQDADWMDGPQATSEASVEERLDPDHNNLFSDDRAGEP